MFQDVGYKMEGIKLESQANQTKPLPDKVDKGMQERWLLFDQDDMKDDKKVKYYTSVSDLSTLLLLMQFLLQESTVHNWAQLESFLAAGYGANEVKVKP